MRQYQKLLMRREAREVLGRRWVNLWLLVLMLVATFVSIAFSEGSMRYLKDKMADPYTNWVSISRVTDDSRRTDEDFNRFRDSLYLDSNMRRFDYRDVIVSQYQSFTMKGRAQGSDYQSGRFFESLNTPLIKAVLSETVEGCVADTTLLQDKSMGVIITMAAAERLGYDETHLPAYVNFMASNDGADSLGLNIDADGYLPVALPVLAVVRRLPNNAQLLSSTYLYEQLRNVGDNTYTFDFKTHSDDYLRQLAFYVSDAAHEEFEKYVRAAVPDSLSQSLEILKGGEYYGMMRTWKPGEIWQVSLGDGHTPVRVFQDMANAIEQKFTDQSEVCRVFHLVTTDDVTPSSMFLSVEFNSLRHIDEFEAFAKEHHIQLELEKVHSMQNFMAVTRDMILDYLTGCKAMVIFSIVCIIMFLVNMLQAYFLRVKRNIGTFKAFGMHGRELTHVYILLLVMIVCAGVISALLLTWAVQGLLGYMGVGKDGFNYLCLWNPTTCVATAVIFVSTVCTVVLVMVRILSQTPGDLIYDRN